MDRVELLVERWVTAPGEIVINLAHASNPSPNLLGARIEADGTPPLTVVGFATSMSRSAGGWVTPEQMAALQPTATQMLYRFTAASTDQQLDASLAEVTAGLPAGALLPARSAARLTIAKVLHNE